MTPAGLHHLAIKAVDPARVAAFYRDVLGLAELTRHHLPDGELRSVWLACGDAIVMIERATRPAARTPAFADDRPGLHLVALTMAAAEREAWRQKLARAGHPVVHETAHTLYVQDPEGNRVGLSSFGAADLAPARAVTAPRRSGRGPRPPAAPRTGRSKRRSRG